MPTLERRYHFKDDLFSTPPESSHSEKIFDMNIIRGGSTFLGFKFLLGLSTMSARAQRKATKESKKEV